MVIYLNKPEYVRVNNKKIKINSSYKTALKCQQVAMDNSISDYERSLAIIYLLFGDEGLKEEDSYNQLLDLALKFLSCGEEVKKNEKPDMDIIQDETLIEASFMTDYGIDLNTQDLHWWTYMTYLKGLTDKSILNRIREIRNMDINEFKDAKTREKIRKAKEAFALKKETPTRIVTDDQERRANEFFEKTGIKR